MIEEAVRAEKWEWERRGIRVRIQQVEIREDGIETGIVGGNMLMSEE